ncbi:MAG TPA: YcgL domain-containing protein [Piscirickettsiaceae bacterium]|nr:YcgL domain-containing protein [Piscirickettsiaceae bacterium]HIQ40835.1 YcgL domain-containing protein [Sulfurivirga caldicuralii]
MSTVKVSAYKSPKVEELYLFLPTDSLPSDLPDELLVFFGDPQHVIDFDLTPERKLPRADAAEVLASLAEKGYYIQTPPAEKEKITDISLPDLSFDRAPD